MLLAFVPFLLFAVLDQRIGTSPALIAAAAASLAIVLRDQLILKKPPKILEVGSLVLFGALGGATIFTAFAPSVVQVRLFVDIGLLAIVAGSIAVGKPFTLQYARERVSPEIASTARFRKTATRIALAWAAAFAVIVAADAAMSYLPSVTTGLGTAVIIAALAAAAWFTSWLPKVSAGKI